MTDEQWRALVAMWSDPKHKEKCVKNRGNWEKVQLHQKTGSHSYIAHCHAVIKEKYKDVPPTEIDFFKECHCNSKTGFTEPVKKVIADMKAIMAESVPEGEPQKTPAEIVYEVLPKTTFLQNTGLEIKGRSTKASAARVEELDVQLEAERHVSLDLREKMERLEKQVGE